MPQHPSDPLESNPFLLALLPTVVGIALTMFATSAAGSGGKDVEVLVMGIQYTLVATFCALLILGIIFRHLIRRHWLSVALLTLFTLPPTVSQIDWWIRLYKLSQPVEIPFPPKPVSPELYRRDSLLLLEKARTFADSGAFFINSHIARIGNVEIDMVMYDPTGTKLFAIVAMEVEEVDSSGAHPYRHFFANDNLVARRRADGDLEVKVGKGELRLTQDSTRAALSHQIRDYYFRHFDFYGLNNNPSIWEDPYIFAQ